MARTATPASNSDPGRVLQAARARPSADPRAVWPGYSEFSAAGRRELWEALARLDGPAR